VSLDNSYVLLWWMCSTGSDYMPLDSSCALLGVVVYQWIAVVCCYGSMVRHCCDLLDHIVVTMYYHPNAMGTTSSVGGDCQLDE
jgi:hypothetical protein